MIKESITVPCPLCDAPIGKVCCVLPGNGDEPLATGQQMVHGQRIKAAAQTGAFDAYNEMMRQSRVGETR